MSYETKYTDWEDRVRYASENFPTATGAAAYLGIKYDTYRKYAIKYNCFNKNQSGKGLTKTSGTKIDIVEVLEGMHPQYQSNKLRIRLLEEGIFNHICNNCKLTEWLGVPIPLELEHINGNSTDHNISNLELLCPNCHAMTDTYRGKNKITNMAG